MAKAKKKRAQFTDCTITIAHPIHDKREKLAAQGLWPIPQGCVRATCGCTRWTVTRTQLLRGDACRWCRWLREWDEMDRKAAKMLWRERHAD